MADAKRGKVRRLGPFRLGKVHRDDHVAECTQLGPIYEAHNEHTGAPAVVLIPGPHVRWIPTEDWTVRATCKASASPPYVALEVEQGPTRSRLKDLGELLNLLTSVALRMKYKARVRRHLTRGAKRRKHREETRRRAWPVVAYGLAVGLATLVLFLGVEAWRTTTGAPQGTQPVASIDGDATDEATVFSDPRDVLAAQPFAYPLPAQPVKGQAKPPCNPELEVEINGGCWLELSKRAPCPKKSAEYAGKCYLPVRAETPPPTTIER